LPFSVSARLPAQGGPAGLSGHTWQVPITDIDSARMALRAGRPEELLGLAECGWVDAKGGIYRLDEPAGPEELAKDVAGFANARTGGLLLVGFSTRKEHDSEILDQVRPVPRSLVDLDRYRKLIRERVIPAPREVSVEWIACGDGKGVVVIDVPAQPPARLPHVVAGPARSGDAGRVSVAVPIREADATVWLPQTEIQRLLAAGWTATGGPSQEYLGNLIERSGEAARELARIENDREHDRMRPVLEGRILPWPGLSDGRDHRLEIQVKTHWPLALILLNVPGDAWFTSTVHMPPVGMDFLIQFPEPGRTSAPFRPGHPASCPVRVAASARGTVTAFAKCRNEYGRTWEDVEVPITLDGTMSGTSADAAPGAGSGRAQDQ
jgi:hypothetical protein